MYTFGHTVKIVCVCGKTRMKLLIADDHTLFRDALVNYIERADPACSVTTAKDLYEAMDALETNEHYDLVLLDLRMPGMNGLDGLKRMREEFPDTPVSLMSGIAEPEDVRNSLDLGASGYLPKTMSGKAMLNGVREIISGKIFVPKDKDGHTVMPSYHADEEKVEPEPISAAPQDMNFTTREREVLSFLVEGASNKEIANALGLKVVTVKLHVRGVCRKLDAKNRTQAAIRAKEMGFTPVSAQVQSV